MDVIKTAIEGVVIIEPKVFKDARGYFFESFSQREFEEKVRKINFVQDNESMSIYGVMRGLHFQTPPFTQSKLVRCVKGAVLDVAVDIRKGSPTYGQHVACLLCGYDEEGKAIAARHKDFFNHLPLREAQERAFSSSYLEALPTALPFFPKRQSSNISATISMHLRPMAVSTSLMRPSVLIGRFQPKKHCSQRKTRSTPSSKTSIRHFQLIRTFIRSLRPSKSPLKSD